MARRLSEDLVALEENEDFVALGRDGLLLRIVKHGPVLDVGAGTGWLAEKLSAKGLDITAIELDKETVRRARAKGRQVISADFLKFKPGRKFRTILMADVLEHIKGDEDAIRRAHGLLEKGGELIISVPYHGFLWSKSDEARLHFRRYSRTELRQKLERNGFRVKRFVFSNAISILPILLARISGIRLPHETFARSPLNKPLSIYLLHFENRLPLPAGSGVLCVAERI